jgi:hypothetical protein
MSIKLLLTRHVKTYIKQLKVTITEHDMLALEKLDNPGLIKELKKWKNVEFRIDNAGKHIKFYLTVNNKSRFVLFSKTIGDWRGKHRQVSDVRKTLIELGAEKK